MAGSFAAHAEIRTDVDAGALWGTTGPLSTALYSQGVEVTGVGFWRVLVATTLFLLYGLVRRDLFHVDARGALIVVLVVLHDDVEQLQNKLSNSVAFSDQRFGRGLRRRRRPPTRVDEAAD